MMRMGRTPAVVTGIGIVSSAGWDRASAVDTMLSAAVGHEETAAYLGVGEVHCRRPPPREGSPDIVSRLITMLRMALDEALDEAELAPGNSLPCLLGIGSSFLMDGRGAPVDVGGLCLTTLSDVCRLRGVSPSPVIVGAGLSSGAAALASAVEKINGGHDSTAMVVAVSVTDELLIGGLHGRRWLSREQPRPFDDEAAGLVPGEAAVALVLSRPADEPAGHPYGVVERVSGCRVPGEGGIMSAWQRVIAEATAGEVVDYVSAAASGVSEADHCEAQALASYLGSRAGHTPISAKAGQFGHCLAAMGPLSVALTLLAMERWFLPATVGLVRPALPSLDHIDGKSRPVRVNRALVNAGGLEQWAWSSMVRRVTACAEMGETEASEPA